jgi:hypothetical protein
VQVCSDNVQAPRGLSPALPFAELLPPHASSKQRSYLLDQDVNMVRGVMTLDGSMVA